MRGVGSERPKRAVYLGHPKPVKAPRKKRRVKPSERRLLEKELWDLTAQYVKLRDGKCVTCSRKDKLTLSHWQKCGKQRIRYDLRNCNTQCSSCNLRHNFYQYRYDNYMLRHYGEAVMLELTELATLPKWKWSVVQLREMIADLQVGLVNWT
jgi:5-methylcytosine-specific restriction endonuclease McrA